MSLTKRIFFPVTSFSYFFPYIEPTPTKEDAKYFYHFHKDFINPCGMTHNMDTFTDTKLTARLKRLNCEFLVRPTVVLSDFADTILQNINYITTNLENFDITQIRRFIDKIGPPYPYLEIINRKTECDHDILILLQLYRISFQNAIYIILYQIYIKRIKCIQF